MKANATVFSKSAPGIISVRGASPARTPLSERMATVEAVIGRAIAENLVKSATVHLTSTIARPQGEPDAVEYTRHVAIRIDSDADTEGVLKALANIFRDRPDVAFETEEGRTE